ncbi:MAG: ADP-ribosylglycohydrolase family protein [Archangium sp.]
MPPPKKKVKPPTHASPEQIRARQKGALLGLAIGEAMGVRTEGRQMPSAMFPELNEGPIIEPMGGGPRELRPGQVSWGSEMAQVLSTTLRNQRRYDLFDAAKSYVRWMSTQPPELVPAPIKAALDMIVDGRSPEFTGRRVWLEGFQKVKDNSVLLRTIPIGVFFHAKREDRINATLEDTSITHFDPICQLACTTLNGVIASAIGAVQERLDPEQLLKVHEAELALAASTLGRKEPDWVSFTKEAADWLREDFKFAQADDPELYGPELHLFHPVPTLLRTTYRLVFWELFHAPSLEAALIDVANRGGDADTNAAITGALFGAIFGEGAIPAAWSERVLEARGNGQYHPQNLITLAGLGPDDAGPRE